jgi:hypothetical protein
MATVFCPSCLTELERRPSLRADARCPDCRGELSQHRRPRQTRADTDLRVNWAQV